MSYIEDSTLHHEATIAHGDSIIIGKKKVQCRESNTHLTLRLFQLIIGIDVHLLVGPVVGLVTDTSVRLLVEVDAAVELSFIVFVTDPLLADGKYKFSEVRSICSSYASF